MHPAYIRSTGMHVPERIVTNDDLAARFDTSHEWIVQRTGIHERRYADHGTNTSDLAVEAVRKLLSKGEVKADEIDCLILATISPDIMFPGVGVFVQEKLGWAERGIPCYDLRQQCSGFIYGLQTAQSFVASGLYRNVLVIGAELHSHGLDFSDRGRAVTVLFGDAAGACVVSRAPRDVDENASRILSTHVHSDGRGALNAVHMILFDQSKTPIIGYDPHNEAQNDDLFPHMASSRNLFVNAVRKMTEVGQSALEDLDIGVDEVDWVLPHQANMRINAKVAEDLGIPQEKVLYNIHKYGNTTAATIPTLLAEFSETGQIKRGDLLLMVAFGSGFTWGSAVVRY
jgi:3-oxoacyl-[acyl-carrier-protein] synthase-3